MATRRLLQGLELRALRSRCLPPPRRCPSARGCSRPCAPCAAFCMPTRIAKNSDDQDHDHIERRREDARVLLPEARLLALVVESRPFVDGKREPAIYVRCAEMKPAREFSRDQLRAFLEDRAGHVCAPSLPREDPHARPGSAPRAAVGRSALRQRRVPRGTSPGRWQTLRDGGMSDREGLRLLDGNQSHREASCQLADTRVADGVHPEDRVDLTPCRIAKLAALRRHRATPPAPRGLRP